MRKTYVRQKRINSCLDVTVSRLVTLVAIVLPFATSVLSADTNTGSDGAFSAHAPTCGKRQTDTEVSERVIGGTRAEPGNWPWVAGVYVTGLDKHICGGVLVTNQIVLTAAHCIVSVSIENILVSLGTSKKVEMQRPNSIKVALKSPVNTVGTDEIEQRAEELYPKGLLLGVEDICVPHQPDNCTAFPMDIAIMTLNETVNFTKNIQPICLPEDCAESPPNASIYVVGWGKILETLSEDLYEDYENAEFDLDSIIISRSEKDGEDDAGQIVGGNGGGDTDDAKPSTRKPLLLDTQDLMQAQVKYMSKQECHKTWNQSYPDYILCSKQDPGGVCKGDSGGPLMYKVNGSWTLDAIVVGGPKNCTPTDNSTFLYIRVSYTTMQFIKPYLNLTDKYDPSYNEVCANITEVRQCLDEHMPEEESVPSESNKMDV